MKSITNYITEKFKINSKTVKNNHDLDLPSEIKDKISDELCGYFQGELEYKGIKYKPGLKLLDEKFNKQICDLLDKMGDHLILCLKIGIKYKQFVDYVQENNDELYKEINDFVL